MGMSSGRDKSLNSVSSNTPTAGELSGRYWQVALWLMLLASCVAFLAGLYASSQGIIDDAYISFRYAKNIAAGLGPVFNPGDPPSDGYTNPLWVIAMVPSFWAGIDPLSYARGLSILLALWGAWLLTLIHRSISTRRAYALSWPVPVMLWLVHHTTTFHLMLGLETTAFSFLLIAIVYLLVRPIAQGTPDASSGIAGSSAASIRNNFRLFLFVALLCGLTRPEGFAAAGFFGGMYVVATRSWPIVRRDVVLFFVGVALLALLKVALFGSLLPNAFFVKVLGGDKLLPGIDLVQQFITHFIVIIVLSLLGSVLGRVKRTHAWFWPAMAITVLFFLVFYLRTVPLMAWQHRYLVPYSFLLVLGASVVIGNGLARAELSPSIIRRWVALFAMVTIVTLHLGFETARSAHVAVQRIAFGKHPDPHQMFALHRSEIELGRQLGEAELGTDLSLAFWDAGAIPFFSGCRFIDLGGLGDNKIARAKDKDELIQYILAQEPDLIVFTTRGAARTTDSIREKLLRPFARIGPDIETLFDTAVARGYRYRGTLVTSQYDLNFFASDSPDATLALSRVRNLIAPADLY